MLCLFFSIFCIDRDFVRIYETARKTLHSLLFSVLAKRRISCFLDLSLLSCPRMARDEAFGTFASILRQLLSVIRTDSIRMQEPTKTQYLHGYLCVCVRQGVYQYFVKAVICLVRIRWHVAPSAGENCFFPYKVVRFLITKWKLLALVSEFIENSDYQRGAMIFALARFQRPLISRIRMINYWKMNYTVCLIWTN